MFLNRNLHSRILVELEELDKVTFKSILVINAIEIHQKECNIVVNTVTFQNVVFLSFGMVFGFANFWNSQTFCLVKIARFGGQWFRILVNK